MTHHNAQHFTRRQMLQRCALGFGSVAFSDIFFRRAMASGPVELSDNLLAAKRPMFAARAKRIIYIFLDGGLSQVDSYDYKPLLQRDDGKLLPASIAKPKFGFAPTGSLLKSPFHFKQYGQSGAWASDLFPEVNKLIDELCFIKSLHHDNEDHFTAKNMIATGSGREARPPTGSWVAYGLGTENANLPAFIEIMPGQPKGTSPAFLPAVYGSTAIGRTDSKSRDRVWDNLADISTGKKSESVENRLANSRKQLDLVQMMNRDHQQRAGADRALDSEVRNMELAFRMQTEAPQIMSFNNESDATKAMYGIGEPRTDDFGRACLLARRFAEQGVRYITVMHSTLAFGNLWDQHKDLYNGHRNNAAAVDLPVAGLLRDLKSRGMLEDTLVMCGSEFGRTPVFEFQDGGEGRLRNGRDHNPHGFTMWFAGAGVKGGSSYGETDDYGYYAVRDKASVHDLHATLLHIMGIDHELLTYRFGGRDYRLTDVSGDVIKAILA